jgi:hypothetical protein
MLLKVGAADTKQWLIGTKGIAISTCSIKALAMLSQAARPCWNGAGGVAGLLRS